MMSARGIKQGTEVYVKNILNSDKPDRKAHVLNIYPYPSNLLVIQYDDDGSMDQVEATHVTTMFEKNRTAFY